MLKSGNLEGVLDEVMPGRAEVPMEAVAKLVQLGCACTAEYSEDRPDMGAKLRKEGVQTSL